MYSAHKPVVLLTGASSGLGCITAELLSASGFSAFGASRTPRQDPARSYTLLPLDVRSDESVDTCVQTVLAQVGQIDVLINCSPLWSIGITYVLPGQRECAVLAPKTRR